MRECGVPYDILRHAHNLDPELKEDIEEAFLTYEFEGTPLGEEFSDADKFIEVSYREAWKPIRTIEKYNEVAYTRDNLYGRKACYASSSPASLFPPRCGAGSPEAGTGSR